MTNSIYNKIAESRGKEKLFALLLDPDKCERDHLKKLLPIASQSNVSMILVGGSLVKSDISSLISEIKKQSQLPVVLFPGNALQFSSGADAILLLSLISGRNSDFLIGKMVVFKPQCST